MSTCPEFDLYSVYLDHEMPNNLKHDFYKHLDECAECKSRFSRLNTIHTALRSDSQTLTLSKTQTEESFKNSAL